MPSFRMSTCTGGLIHCWEIRKTQVAELQLEPQRSDQKESGRRFAHGLCTLGTAGWLPQPWVRAFMARAAWGAGVQLRFWDEPTV